MLPRSLIAWWNFSVFVHHLQPLLGGGCVLTFTRVEEMGHRYFWKPSLWASIVCLVESLESKWDVSQTLIDSQQAVRVSMVWPPWLPVFHFCHDLDLLLLVDLYSKVHVINFCYLVFYFLYIPTHASPSLVFWNWIEICVISNFLTWCVSKP